MLDLEIDDTQETLARRWFAREDPRYISDDELDRQFEAHIGRNVERIYQIGLRVIWFSGGVGCGIGWMLVWWH